MGALLGFKYAKFEGAPLNDGDDTSPKEILKSFLVGQWDNVRALWAVMSEEHKERFLQLIDD